MMKVLLVQARSLAGIAVLVLASVAAAFAAGEDVYKTKCASCHGADGKGETAIGKKMYLRDLASDDVQKQHDSELKLIIEKGKGKMPGYKGKLTDKQLDDLIVFIRSLKQSKYFKLGSLALPGR